jgi:hypothetical protein
MSFAKRMTAATFLGTSRAMVARRMDKPVVVVLGSSPASMNGLRPGKTAILAGKVARCSRTIVRRPCSIVKKM